MSMANKCPCCNHAHPDRWEEYKVQIIILLLILLAILSNIIKFLSYFRRKLTR
jgi:hypothetical protein